jgi:hypothetical protein
MDSVVPWDYGGDALQYSAYQEPLQASDQSTIDPSILGGIDIHPVFSSHVSPHEISPVEYPNPFITQIQPDQGPSSGQIYSTSAKYTFFIVTLLTLD